MWYSPRYQRVSKLRYQTKRCVTSQKRMALIKLTWNLSRSTNVEATVSFSVPVKLCRTWCTIRACLLVLRPCDIIAKRCGWTKNALTIALSMWTGRLERGNEMCGIGNRALRPPLCLPFSAIDLCACYCLIFDGWSLAPEQKGLINLKYEVHTAECNN